jgi:transposase
MRKRLEVNPKHASFDILKQLYITEKNARTKTRLLTILHFYEGKTSLEVAKLMHQSDSTVRQALHRYNKLGLKGLKDIPHPIKKRIFSQDELSEIDAAISHSPSEVGLNYNNWSGPLLVAWVEIKFKKSISIGTAYNILHELNYSKTRAKKMNKSVDKEILEAFREQLDNLLNSKDENTVILYEDEAIITSEPTATSVWSKVGTQPIVKTGSGGTRERAVIFGAVNSETGDLTEQIYDKGNSENFKSFLKYNIRKTLE